MARDLEKTSFTVSGLAVIGPEKTGWSSRPVDSLVVVPGGILCDRHFGMTRVVRRFESEERRGEVPPNDRQVSLADARDLHIIGERMNLPIADIENASGASFPNFLARAMGTNIVLSSEEDSLNDAIRARDVLVFGWPDPLAASIQITEYNPPCPRPGIALHKMLGEIGIDLGIRPDKLGAQFVEVAADTHGWVASSNCHTGKIALGQQMYMQTALLPPGGQPALPV